MPTLHTFTEAGGHPVNEDAFEVQTHPLASDCFLCFLADGQGGRAGGGLAARTACHVGMERACAVPPNRLQKAGAWLPLLSAADEAVGATQGAGFTTLVGFFLQGPWLVGASSGDSAVLSISAGGPPDILTALQRKNPPVGSGGALFVPFAARLTPPWRVLAMTDGVWKYVGWDRLIEIAGKEAGREGIDQLQRRARLPGSGGLQDDFTVVLFEQE